MNGVDAAKRIQNASIFIDQYLCGTVPATVSGNTWVTIQCNGGNGIVGTHLKIIKGPNAHDLKLEF